MSWIWFKAFILKSEVLKIHDANMKQQNPVLFNYCNLKGFFFFKVSGFFQPMFHTSLGFLSTFALQNVL